jgi:hypothetical protein
VNATSEELTSPWSGEKAGSWSESSGGPWRILPVTPVERWTGALNALEREEAGELTFTLMVISDYKGAFQFR